MKEIVWSKSYSVGVASIDEQHKRIVALINELARASDVSVGSDLISDLLGKLTVYAHDHFKFEERLMEECGYPNLAEHKKEHKEYRIKLVDFCEGTIIHKKSIPEDVFKFLRDWLLNHILESDLECRPFFKKHGFK